MPVSILERGAKMRVLCLTALVPQVAETALNSISEPTWALARQQTYTWHAVDEQIAFKIYFIFMHLLTQAESTCVLQKWGTIPHHLSEVGQRIISGFPSLKTDKGGTVILRSKAQKHP